MEEKLKIVRDILGGYRRSSNEFLFICPFCNHHKKKMSINFAINSWKCWVCDSRGKNIYRLVRKFGDYQQNRTSHRVATRIYFPLQQATSKVLASAITIFKRQESFRQRHFYVEDRILPGRSLRRSNYRPEFQ
jgi:hypothetical protein